jgi:hypothetical protein
MHRDLSLRPLSEWITRCLRHKPGSRPPIAELRRQLAAVRTELDGRDWPLLPSSQAAQRIARAVLK